MSISCASSNNLGPLGSVKLILGCMFSNKTLTLITCVERYYYAKKRCIIIKHSIDTRYDHLSKHGGLICNNGVEYSTIPIVTSTVLGAVDISSYDVIGVTEAQFYTDLLIVDDWATAGKIVICDGLDGDINRCNFGNIHMLIPKCEEVVKLNAVCISCGANAAFTRRIAARSTNIEHQTEHINAPEGSLSATNIVDPGGSDKYQPVCRGCYMRMK